MNRDQLAMPGGFCVIYFQQGLVGTLPLSIMPQKATDQRKFDSAVKHGTS
jgi:hypothetical protein